MEICMTLLKSATRGKKGREDRKSSNCLMASSWYNPLSPNLVYKSRFLPAMPLYRRSHSSEIEC